MSELDVIVVGAGLAGLSAARVLRNAGREVLVVEARNRVGGRVSSVRSKSGLVDVGAQWIGPQQRRVYELIRRYGLTTVRAHTRGKTVFAIGDKTYVGQRSLPPLPWRTLLDVAQVGARLEWAARSTSASEPWRSASVVGSDQQSADDWIAQAALSTEGRAFWSALIEAETCADPSQSSALDLFQQTRSAGGMAALASAEQDYLAEGAQALASGMAQELAGGIELEAPVRRIEHGPRGASVRTDRCVWRARDVIVAVPLPLVAAIDFDPVLPDARRALNARIVPASVIKTILLYDRPHWRDNGYSGLVFSQSGPVCSLLDGGDIDGAGVLVALTTGSHARRMSALTANARHALIAEHVQRCFPFMAQRAPDETIECDWSAEAWSGGGYAARLAPGAWTEAGNTLRQPVGPIHWAGTETASRWRSFMEGALQSGERAANEVLARDSSRIAAPSG